MPNKGFKVTIDADAITAVKVIAAGRDVSPSEIVEEALRYAYPNEIEAVADDS